MVIVIGVVGARAEMRGRARAGGFGRESEPSQRRRRSWAGRCQRQQPALLATEASGRPSSAAYTQLDSAAVVCPRLSARPRPRASRTMAPPGAGTPPLAESSPPPPTPPSHAPQPQQQPQPHEPNGNSSGLAPGPRRRGSPALSANSGTAGTASERDPFLAQTAGIPLTEQDRQEGYDVELLNARPRGRYSADLGENGPAGAAAVPAVGAGAGAGALGATQGGSAGDTDDDSLGAPEKYAGGMGGGLAQVSSHPGLAPAGPLGAAAGAGAAGIALGPIGSGGGVHPAYGGAPGLYNKEYALGGGAGGGGPGGGGGKGSGADRFSGGANSGTTAISGRRKPWFLRPLPLLLVAGVVIGIALAVGLGVGLSQSSSKSNDLSASGASQNGTSSDSRSRSIGSTGTVVPSSLYSSYTSEHPQSTSVVVETAVTRNGTSVTTMTFVTSVPAPANGTTLATTGNRPVPAASSTTINGTIVSALTSTAAAAFVTNTARIRRR